MDKRNVGRLGEAELRRWAQQVGIAVNQAYDDEHGWDFLLEFPYETSQDGSSAPLDKQPAPLKCLVQVKSTDQDRPRVSINLSNWLNLVDNPLPVFFLVLKFGGTTDCKEAYVIHLWERDIRQVSKRLRKLSSEASVRLNKRTLELKWSQKDMLENRNGEGLAEKIEQRIFEVVNSFEQYAEAKATIRQNVGYEEASALMDITFPVPKGYEDASVDEFLVDFSLGLADIPIEEGTVWDYRFGEKADPKTLESGGILSANLPDGEGMLLTIRSDTDNEIAIPVNAYGPAGVNVDAKYYKYRLDFHGGHILVAPSYSRVSFTFDSTYEEARTLSEFNEESRLLLFLRQCAQQDSNIDFYLDTGDTVKKFNGAKMDYGQLSDDMYVWAEFVHCVYETLRVYEFTDITIRDKDFSELWQQKTALQLLGKIFSPHLKNPDMRFSSNLDEPLCPEELCSEFCFPLVVSFKLHEYVFMTAIACIGNMQKNERADKPYKMYVKRFEIVNKNRFHLKDISFNDKQSQSLNNIERTYEEDLNIIRWW